MGLLDLPPEIFERIIAHYVDIRGVRLAWLRRSVCRTFRDAIRTEVLGKQPASAFMNRRDSRFLRSILEKFLETRTYALYGAHDVLPTHINKIVDVLVRTSGTSRPVPRSVWIREVIGALVGDCVTRDICKLAYRPNDENKSKVMSSSGREEAMSVAIMMSRSDIICALVAEQNGCMWIKTSTGSDLCCALEVAAQHGDLGLVEMFLLHAQRSTVKKVMKLQTGTVLRSIAQTLQDNEPIAIVLLEWFFSNVQRKEIYYLATWFEEACVSGTTLFLGKLIKVSTPSMRQAYRVRFLRIVNPQSNAFRHLSTKPFEALVACFLDAGLFNRSNIDFHEPMQHRIPVSSLLDTAVRRGDLAGVQCVLEAGSNADGVHSEAEGMSYPLRHAVRQKHFDIVALLVEYGADPDSDLGAQDARYRSARPNEPPH